MLPPESAQVEFEGEIGVVLKAPLRRATVGEAEAAIAGITCVNDVTARDLQRSEEQWTRAKGFDTFCAVGPRVVALDPSRFASLEVRCRLNGETRQHGLARDMVFSIGTLVAYISQVMTLEPGDLVATGTPAGVGVLRAGDTVEVEIPLKSVRSAQSRSPRNGGHDACGGRVPSHAARAATRRYCRRAKVGNSRVGGNHACSDPPVSGAAGHDGRSSARYVEKWSLPLVRRIPGFVAVSADAGEAERILTAWGLFETAEGAEAASGLAQDWFGKEWGSFRALPPEVIGGQVLAAATRRWPEPGAAPVADRRAGLIAGSLGSATSAAGASSAATSRTGRASSFRRAERAVGVTQQRDAGAPGARRQGPGRACRGVPARGRRDVGHHRHGQCSGPAASSPARCSPGCSYFLVLKTQRTIERNSSEWRPAVRADAGLTEGDYARRSPPVRGCRSRRSPPPGAPGLSACRTLSAKPAKRRSVQLTRQQVAGDEQFGVQDGRARGPADRVVTQDHKPVVEHLVGEQPADRDAHPATRVPIDRRGCGRSGSERTIRGRSGAVGSRRAWGTPVNCANAARPRRSRSAWRGQLDAHLAADVAIETLDVHPVALGAHRERRGLKPARAQVPENLSGLALDLLLPWPAMNGITLSVMSIAGTPGYPALGDRPGASSRCTRPARTPARAGRATTRSRSPSNSDSSRRTRGPAAARAPQSAPGSPPGTTNGTSGSIRYADELLSTGYPAATKQPSTSRAISVRETRKTRSQSSGGSRRWTTSPRTLAGMSPGKRQRHALGERLARRAIRRRRPR